MPERLQESTLLQNGVRMPWLGLGTWRAAEGGEVENAVRWALELGYRSIDTVSAYGNEEGVGRGIRESGLPREEIFVTTKIWNDDRGYDSTLRAFEESLNRLGTGYVDLYLIHWPGEKTGETWKALEKIYRDGRATAIGVSNFMVHHLKDLLDRSEVTPLVNQIEFHPRLVQPELLEFCRRHRIQVEAWSPLMRGGVFQLPEVEQVAARHGKSPAQVVLRWNLQHGVVTIPKSVHRERLAANADIFDFELSEEEMAALDGLDRGERIGPDPETFGF